MLTFYALSPLKIRLINKYMISSDKGGFYAQILPSNNTFLSHAFIHFLRSGSRKI